MWKLGFAAPRQGATASAERGLKRALPQEYSPFAGLLGTAMEALILNMDSPGPATPSEAGSPCGRLRCSLRRDPQLQQPS